VGAGSSAQRYCADMSQQNVDIVRRMYELWSGGDWEGMVELVDPEVEQHGTVGGLAAVWRSRSTRPPSSTFAVPSSFESSRT